MNCATSLITSGMRQMTGMTDAENFGEWLEEHLPLIIDQNIVSLAVIGIDNEDNLKSL